MNPINLNLSHISNQPKKACVNRSNGVTPRKINHNKENLPSSDKKVKNLKKNMEEYASNPNQTKNKKNLGPSHKKVKNLTKDMEEDLSISTLKRKASGILSTDDIAPNRNRTDAKRPVESYNESKTNPYKDVSSLSDDESIADGDILNLKKKENAQHLIEGKTSRRISRYEDNKAASVSEIKDLGAGIREHAHMRLQLFYAEAMLIAGVAKRTNGTTTDIDVWVGRATKQDGQGDRKNHAAHSNAASGRRDDLKEHYIQQIVDEGVTPVKSQVLSRIRHMPTPEKERLQQNHSNEALVRAAIEKIWTGNSVISNTEFEDQLNATDKLPRNLNLGCDLVLEKAIRPLVADLMMQVMKGIITPRDATDRYTTAIQDHFAEKLKEIKHKLKELKKADMLDVESIKKAENQQFYHQNEMNGTNTLDYNAFDGKK